jgi:hypothetical protein
MRATFDHKAGVDLQLRAPAVSKRVRLKVQCCFYSSATNVAPGRELAHPKRVFRSVPCDQSLGERPPQAVRLRSEDLSGLIALMGLYELDPGGFRGRAASPESRRKRVREAGDGIGSLELRVAANRVTLDILIDRKPLVADLNVSARQVVASPPCSAGLCEP